MLPTRVEVYTLVFIMHIPQPKTSLERPEAEIPQFTTLIHSTAPNCLALRLLDNFCDVFNVTTDRDLFLGQWCEFPNCKGAKKKTKRNKSQMKSLRLGSELKLLR